MTPISRTLADHLHVLTVPFDGLPAHEVIDVLECAHTMGMESMSMLAACLHCEDHSPFPGTAEHYLEHVVYLALESGLITEDRVMEWQDMIRSGEALHDPRVMAFCASWTARASGFLAEIEESRRVLARFLEVPTQRITLADVGPQGQIVLEYGQEQFILLTQDDTMAVFRDSVLEHLADLPAILFAQYPSLTPQQVVEIEELKRTLGPAASEDIAAILGDLRPFMLFVLNVAGHKSFVCGGDPGQVTEEKFGDYYIWRFPPMDEAEIEGGYEEDWG